MKQPSRILKPVKRERAEHYVRLTLLSFAGSVILTRLFLSLTGYPQVGGGPLHIAHVLWGGLLLFVAALLPLLFSNRWVYRLGAILAGVGVGLFIDEVGKFITQTNDYFYPAAAPIIYAFFLMIVLVYAQLRRPTAQDARAELYRTLDALAEVLDQDLDADELAEMKAGLQHIVDEHDEPDLGRLAAALLDFANSHAIRLTPAVPGLWARWRARASSLEARWLSRSRLRPLLVVALVLMGVWALADLVLFVILAVRSGGMTKTVEVLVATGRLVDVPSLSVFLVRVAIEGLMGLLLLLGARLLFTGREQRGVTFAYYGLLVSLTTVDLLVFYLDQFGAVLGALAQFAVLLALMYYRRRYLVPAAGYRQARDTPAVPGPTTGPDAGP